MISFYYRYLNCLQVRELERSPKLWFTLQMSRKTKPKLGVRNHMRMSNVGDKDSHSRCAPFQSCCEDLGCKQRSRNLRQDSDFRCRHFKHTLKPTQHNVHSYFSSSRTPTNSVHFGCFATFRHTNTNNVFRMVWFRLLQLTECFYLFIAYVLLSFQLWLALAKRVFYQATEMLQEQCFWCSV